MALLRALAVVVQLPSHVQLLDPWTAAHQASLPITNSWSLLKPMSLESVMPSNHLIALSPPSSLPAISLESSPLVRPLWGLASELWAHPLASLRHRPAVYCLCSACPALPTGSSFLLLPLPKECLLQTFQGGCSFSWKSHPQPHPPGDCPAHLVSLPSPQAPHHSALSPCFIVSLALITT